MAQTQFKFTRPSTPFTEGVLQNIEAKTNVLLKKFKDFKNDERRESRRNEIVGRFHEEVMKAYRKFVESDRCSYESYVDLYLKSAMKHYIRSQAKILREERRTLSGDVHVNPGESDSPTHMMMVADPNERMLWAIADFDYREVVAIVRLRYPVCARILDLHREGYKLKDIASRIGVTEDSLYDALWPKAKRVFLHYHNFSANS